MSHWSLISSFAAMSMEKHIQHSSVDDDSLSYSVLGTQPRKQQQQPLSMPGESLLVGNFRSATMGRVDDSYDEEDDSSSMGDYVSLEVKTSPSTQRLVQHHLYLNAMCLAYARRREECGGSTEDVVSTDLEHLVDDRIQPKKDRPYPADIWQTWSSWRNDDGSSHLLSEVLICNIQQDALDEFVYAICLAPQLDMVTVVMGASTGRRLGQGFTEYDFHNTTVGVDGCWAADIIGHEALFETILELVQEHSCARLSLVGYGGGAALATICSLWMSQHTTVVEQFHSISVYTFGSPRVGDDRFANLYQRVQEEGKLLHIRFADEFDMTTRRPRLSWEGPYHSVGLPILFRNTKTRGMNSYWQHLQNWEADKPLVEWYPMATKKFQRDAQIRAKKVRQRILCMTILLVYVPLIGLAIYQHSKESGARTTLHTTDSSLVIRVKSEQKNSSFDAEVEGKAIVEESDKNTPASVEEREVNRSDVVEDDFVQHEQLTVFDAFGTVEESNDEDHELIASRPNLEQVLHTERKMPNESVTVIREIFENQSVDQIENKEGEINHGDFEPAQHDMLDTPVEMLEDDVQETPSRAETTPQVSPEVVHNHAVIFDTPDVHDPSDASKGAFEKERESKQMVSTKKKSLASTDYIDQNLAEVANTHTVMKDLVSNGKDVAAHIADDNPVMIHRDLCSRTDVDTIGEPTDKPSEVPHGEVDGGSIGDLQICPDAVIIGASIGNYVNGEKETDLLDIESTENDHYDDVLARQELQQALQESAGAIVDHPPQLPVGDNVDIWLDESSSDSPIFSDVFTIDPSLNELLLDDRQDEPYAENQRHVTPVTSMHTNDPSLDLELVDLGGEYEPKQNVTGLLAGLSTEVKFATDGVHNRTITFPRVFGVPRTKFAKAKYWHLKRDRVVSFLQILATEQAFEHWATEKWHHDNPSVCKETELTATVMVQEAFEQAGVHIEM